MVRVAAWRRIVESFDTQEASLPCQCASSALRYTSFTGTNGVLAVALRLRPMWHPHAASQPPGSPHITGGFNLTSRTP